MIIATHGILASQIQSFVGLLDTYPNAAAAYSLRKLRSAYTGSAIRVRRSSDNTEQDIGFVNNILDTSSLTSFCGSGNGFVTTWYDQSGNAANVTQTTAANQPQIVSSGSVILQNGKPSIQWDGTNDFLQNTSSLSYTNFSLFNLFKFNSYSTTGYQAIIQYSKLDLAQVLTNFQSSDTGVSTIASYSVADIGTTRRLHTHLSTISGSTTTSTLYLNGGNKATGSRILTSTKTTIAIGATDLGAIPFNGNNQEIILYPSDQSSNRTGIETNINNFYSIY